MARTFEYPVYVGVVEHDLSLRMLGGPFDDIDDALDCCWDKVTDPDAPVPRSSLFLVETGSGRPSIVANSREALPFEEDD